MKVNVNDDNIKRVVGIFIAILAMGCIAVYSIATFEKDSLKPKYTKTLPPPSLPK